MISVVSTSDSDARVRLRLEGPVTTSDLSAMHQLLSSVVTALRPSVDLVVDVSAVTALDDLCAAVLRSAILRAQWNRNLVAVVADPGSEAEVVLRAAVHAPGVGLFPDSDSAADALDAHRAAHGGRGARAVTRLGAPAHGVANPFRSNLP